MLNCPHCQREIILRNLKHQGMFKSYRVCPGCGGCFTVDVATKRRQAAFIVVALGTLVFTLLLYYRGTAWLVPTIVMIVLLGGLIYWANKRVYLVPAEGQSSQGT